MEAAAAATAVAAAAEEQEPPADAAPAPAAAATAAPNTAPAPEPHSSDDGSFFGGEEDEDEGGRETLAGGGAVDEENEDASAGCGGDKLTSAQLARRRLRAVRRLHAAYARQARVLMSALQEKARKVKQEEEEAEAEKEGEEEKDGGGGDKKRRRKSDRSRSRPADFPASLRPDPLLEDGKTPCADPGTISDADEAEKEAAEREAKEEKAKGKAAAAAAGSKGSKSRSSIKKVSGGKRRTRASADRGQEEEAGVEEEEGEGRDEGEQWRASSFLPLPPPPPRSWRSALRSGLPSHARLESLAAASTARELDERGALAALCARECRFLIRSPAVALGRAPAASASAAAGGDDDKLPPPVPGGASPSLRLLRALDADLSQAGSDSRKVSRQQARIELGADGRWSLTATGRRALSVDGAKLAKGERCELKNLSLVEAGGIRMMFLVNSKGVRRALARSAALGL